MSWCSRPWARPGAGRWSAAGPAAADLTRARGRSRPAARRSFSRPRRSPTTRRARPGSPRAATSPRARPRSATRWRCSTARSTRIGWRPPTPTCARSRRARRWSPGSATAAASRSPRALDRRGDGPAARRAPPALGGPAPPGAGGRAARPAATACSPARSSRCARAPTSTAAAPGRRRSGCASRWRRGWRSWPRRRPSPTCRERLAELREPPRRRADAANAAVRGELSDEQRDAVETTVDRLAAALRARTAAGA